MPMKPLTRDQRWAVGLVLALVVGFLAGRNWGYHYSAKAIENAFSWDTFAPLPDPCARKK